MSLFQTKLIDRVTSILTLFVESLFQPQGRIVGLAVDIDAGYVFWSDISLEKRGIYRAVYPEGGNLTDVTLLTDGKLVPTQYFGTFGYILFHRGTIEWMSAQRSSKGIDNTQNSVS